jgi:hypothetical protein
VRVELDGDKAEDPITGGGVEEAEEAASGAVGKDIRERGEEEGEAIA